MDNRIVVLKFAAELLEPQPIADDNPIVMTITGLDADGKPFTETITRRDVETTRRLFFFDEPSAE